MSSPDVVSYVHVGTSQPTSSGSSDMDLLTLPYFFLSGSKLREAGLSSAPGVTLSLRLPQGG